MNLIKIIYASIIVFFAANAFSYSGMNTDKFILHKNNAELILQQKQSSNVLFGFNRDADIECNSNNTSISLRKAAVSELNGEDCYLCSFYKHYISTKKNYVLTNGEISGNKLFLQKIDMRNFNSDELNSVRNTILDTKSTIVKLERKKDEINSEIKYLTGQIRENSVSDKPYYIENSDCEKISVNFKGVQFSLENTISISGAEVGKYKGVVIRAIVFKNKSSVDIKGNGYVVFGYKNPRTQIPDFRPQPIYIIKEPSKDQVVNKRLYSANQEAAMAPSKTDVRKGKGNVYYIDNLLLKSNGENQRYKIDNKSAEVRVRNVVYPYMNLKVFKEISYKKKFDTGNVAYNVHLGDEYYKNVDAKIKEGRVFLYGGENRNFVVSKSRDVNFKNEEGFFDKKKVITDGYKITISNAYNETLPLNIVERIPISTDERVVVRDVTVEDKSGNNLLENGVCSINEKGEIECNIHVDPDGTQNLIVKYKIVYDNDIYKIRY